MNYGYLFGFAVSALTCISPTFTASQDGESLFGTRTLSVTYGPYARLEMGGAFASLTDGA